MKRVHHYLAVLKQRNVKTGRERAQHDLAILGNIFWFRLFSAVYTEKSEDSS
jgi:hypothetical protein